MQKFLRRLDGWQRKRPFVSFVFAVIKKAGDDQLGYQAALITYYGFLALFPLLLVATTVLQIVLYRDQHLQTQVLNSINQYLPMIGRDLQNNIHGFGKSGLALIVGTIIALYGARGVANALQNGLNHIWQVPRVQRPGFPKNLATSFGLLLGNLGFVLAAVLSGLAAGLGRSFIFTAISILISLIILFGTFMYIFKAGTVSMVARRRHNYLSALGAALGLQVLQLIGGFVLNHELTRLDGLYGTFAVVLGLLFWLYLQVQVVLYSVEITAVRRVKLWPRSIVRENLTPQDLRAYGLAASREQLHPDVKIYTKIAK
ncbi:MAG: YihY/virulence factor BrkB family protein [Candidatus Saccharimonadales bacterium]